MRVRRYNHFHGLVTNKITTVMYVVAGLGMLIASFSHTPVEIASASSFTCGTYSSIKAAPSGSGSLVSVTNDSQLTSAIAAAGPGDVIELADGNYARFELLNMNGTLANPITFQAANQWGADISLAGSSQNGVLLRKSSYINVYGIDVNGGGTSTGSAFRTGMRYSSTADSSNGGSSYVGFSHNRSQNMGQEAFSFKGKYDGSEPSTFVTATCNMVDTTGQRSTPCNPGSTNYCGEGFYVGNGITGNDTSHDIIIQGNEIKNVYGSEAIEVKARAYNVSILDNYIHDIQVSNAGAISLSADATDYQDGNYLIDGNVIHAVTTITSGVTDGNGILVGHGNTTVRNNIIWDTQHRGIIVYDEHGSLGFGSSANNDVSIYNNTIFGCGSSYGLECIGVVGLGQGGVSVDKSIGNNLGDFDSGVTGELMSSGTDRVAISATDFLGPITGTADAGSGPGSGFALKSGSGAIDSAATISGFTSDINGGGRPSGAAWDFGAYEFASVGGSGGSGGNSAPTDIQITNLVVPSTNTAGNTIGTLSSIDVDGSDTHTYSLVSGPGDTDNASFQISGDQLQLQLPLTSGTYSIRLNSDDGTDSYNEVYSISYEPYNTQITLTSLTDGGYAAPDPPNDPPNVNDDNFTTRWSREDDGSFLEAQLSGGPYTIDHVDLALWFNGTVRTSNFDIQTSPDGTTFTNVTGGNGSSGNYTSSGNTEGMETFRFTAVPSTTHIRIVGHGNSLSDWNSILELDVYQQPSAANSTPTDILLSSTSINENVSPNATIGTLSTTDSDGLDTHIYTLVSGAGDTDNISFSISGSNLRISSSPDFETRSSYSIRIQTNDGNGGIYPEQFTITINDLNATPTDIALSNTTIGTGLPTSTLVGSLSSTDDNEDGTEIYSKIVGTGDTNNADFTVSGTQLLTSSSLTTGSYSVRLNINDGVNDYPEQFIITVSGVANSTPTDILLSSTSINENVSPNATIGTLSTTDSDGLDTHIYTLVSGAGDTDNISFSISGSNLRISSSPDFETRSSYSIRIQTNDSNGGVYQKQFTITINDLNATPTDIALTSSSVDENAGTNATIGILSSTDDNEDGTEIYTLVAGVGATDNASFNISGTTLRLSASADFETQSSYSVRLNINDGANNYPEQFTITINDLNLSPVALNLSTTSINDTLALPSTVVGTLTTVDDNEDGTLIYSMAAGVGDTNNTSFAVGGGSNDQLVIGASTLTAGTYTIRLQVSDGANIESQQFIITVVDTTLPDTTPPTITLIGANPYELIVGTTYSDPGFSASDNIDGTITGNVNSVNGVNTNVVGSYSVTYSVTDAAGNTATTVRAVNILAVPVVIDSDGIDDTTENNAPNSGDNNGDGTQDSSQNNVASTPNLAITSSSTTQDPNNDYTPTTSNPSQYISLQTPTGTTVTSLTIEKESDQTTQDTNYDYPLGLFNFTATVPTGSTQTIIIYLDQQYDTSDWTWRKYNTTNNTYTTIPAANVTYSTATVGTETVTTVSYDVTDGGTLDEDGLANGTIVDPSGPAVLADTDTTTTTTTTDTDPDTLETTGQNMNILTTILIGGTLIATVGYMVRVGRGKLYRL